MTGVEMPGRGQGGGKPARRPADSNPNLVSLQGSATGAVPLDGASVPLNPSQMPAAYGTPEYLNPEYGNPEYADPAFGNPGYENPDYSNPAYGNPEYGNPGFNNMVSLNEATTGAIPLDQGAVPMDPYSGNPPEGYPTPQPYGDPYGGMPVDPAMGMPMAPNNHWMNSGFDYPYSQPMSGQPMPGQPQPIPGQPQPMSGPEMPIEPPMPAPDMPGMSVPLPGATLNPAMQPTPSAPAAPNPRAFRPAPPPRGNAPYHPNVTEPLDPRLVAQRAEQEHPDLQDLRSRVPFNMPTIGTEKPAAVGRAARRVKTEGEPEADNNNRSRSGFTVPGDPKAAVSFKELLGQPVSNMAAATILSPKEVEDSDGLQMRAVGLAVGEVPEVDARHEIPYIAREHPSYYTGYEISLIMESIRDPEHARQVLARIVAVPRWIRWVICLFGGICGAAVSALNAFLSLIAFISLMVIVLLFTYSFAGRIGSGRFYDPTGYKTIWLGSFMPIGLLSAIIVARSMVGQPWLAMIAFVMTTACGLAWTTWIQRFQIRRLLSSEIPDAPIVD